MTTDELERDLKTLAERRETDEQLRLAIRGRLTDQLQPRPKRHFSRRIAFGVAAVAAAGAASIAVLVGANGSGGPALANAAIIRHAIRAVTSPAGTILHVKVLSVQNGTQFVGEWWQQTGPPYANRGLKGDAGHFGESADNGTTSFQYDPGTNTIYERPDSSRPTFTDPISQVRQQLQNGQAHVDGAVVIDGVSLYKIALPQGLVGYFDRSDYMPRYLDDPQRDGTVERLRVVTYEHLAMTRANESLLSMTAQHPDARIDTNSNDAPSGK
jgi:hypothetical protein